MYWYARKLWTTNTHRRSGLAVRVSSVSRLESALLVSVPAMTRHNSKVVARRTIGHLASERGEVWGWGVLYGVLNYINPWTTVSHRRRQTWCSLVVLWGLHWASLLLCCVYLHLCVCDISAAAAVTIDNNHDVYIWGATNKSWHLDKLKISLVKI